MSNLPNDASLLKLHESFNSLNVTLAHIQLSYRRLQLRDRSPFEDQLMSSLQQASDRLLVAIAQLRELEAIVLSNDDT
jgi:hypothetical protein